MRDILTLLAPARLASLHERNFPQLVRQASRLVKEDVAWLAGCDPFSPPAKKESASLRAKIEGLQRHGSPLLSAGTASTDQVQQLAGELSASAIAGATGASRDDVSVQQLANQLTAVAITDALSAGQAEASVEQVAKELTAAAVERAMGESTSRPPAKAVPSKPAELL